MKATVFRIRTYADPKTPTDVWLIERDGATEQELMHGEVRAGGLRSLLDVLDNTEGFVVIEREKSPLAGPEDESGPQSGR